MQHQHKSESSNGNGAEDQSDILWGAKQISVFVKRPVRWTHLALKQGWLPGRKTGKLWSTTRTRLLQHLSGDAA
jgi:hypothetical protein